jgi:hypothetical protein
MTYGDLPDHGFENVKLVLHTTETKGMPSFGGGSTAPHYVYAPLTGLWTMFAEYDDGRVGTMKGHATNHANDSAFQVEILAYSNEDHRPWVGEFTDANYDDLAAFYRWAIDRYPIGAAVTPTPAGGFKYGASAPTRGTEDAYNAFSGVTCHGWVYGNSHWDTGVLDLQRIHDLATEEESTIMLWQINQRYSTYEELTWLLFQAAGGTINVNQSAAHQLEPVLGKTDPTLVTVDDFDYISVLLNMDDKQTDKLIEDGLYPLGKEIAALRSLVYD